MPRGINSYNGLISNGFRRKIKFRRNKISALFWTFYTVDYEIMERGNGIVCEARAAVSKSETFWRLA
jgi:hypothetical protein